MVRPFLGWLTVAVLSAIPIHPFAQSPLYERFSAVNGNTLYEVVQSDRHAALHCMAGVIDGAALWRSICFQGTFNPAQALDVIGKYLADNPGRRDLPAPRLIREALVEAFPCDRPR